MKEIKRSDMATRLLTAALVLCTLFHDNQADLAAASRCSIQYVAQIAAASTTQAKCVAFLTYVNCNTEAAKDASAGDVQVIQDNQDQVAAALGLDCTPYMQQQGAKQPEMYALNGSLYFEVDDSKSVSFVRTRREAITPWTLSAEISTTNSRLNEIDISLASFQATQSTSQANFADLMTAIATQAILSTQSIISNAATVADITEAVSTEASRAISVEASLASSLDQMSAETALSFNSLSTSVSAALGSQSQAVRDLSSALDSLETATQDGDGGVQTQVTTLLSRVTATESKITATTSCATNGQLFTGSACTKPQGVLLTCSVDTVGAVRIYNSRLEVCAENAGQYAFVAFSLSMNYPLGSFSNPAGSASAILAANPSAASGLYWIQPTGEMAPALTYCDMTFMGGGYMLAAYGHVAGTGTHNLNRAIPPMNHGNGYNWNPTARARSNGVISLPSGAVYLARQSTSMIMAAGNTPETGGLNGYSHVYEIDISHTAGAVTFKNHNRDLGAVGGGGHTMMVPAAYTVRGLRGDSGTAVRFGLREALGVTWGDTYPTGYGFNGCGLVQFCTWGDGPFFPSVHSGDSRCGSADSTFLGADVGCGRTTYAYQGWYGLNSGQYNRVGQTSIWFK
eukprot:m.33401 g.33401  ORF g.33401 m.33401 type:complete len:627 (-) comp10878_c0_seq1:163-2043(-)